MTADLSDLLDELQRRNGSLVILCEDNEWTIYGPWGVVREATLFTACIIVLEHMDAIDNSPSPIVDNWPDTRGPDATI